MVDTNEIDNDIDTIKHIQEQFGGNIEGYNRTIH